MSLRLITSAPSSDAAYRTELIRRYLASARQGRLRLLDEAAAYDKANPGAPSLTDELRGARRGDPVAA